MRVKLNMKKLTKPEAQFVSLVRRSASQIPFRIQKSADGDGEDTMINLSAISRVIRKSDDDKPKVSGVVVRKMDNMEPVKASLSEAGYDVSNPIDNGDGTVMYAQEKNPENGAIPVRMNDSLVLVCKGVPDEAQPYSDTLGADGYCDSLIAGANALPGVLVEAIRSADDHDALRANVRKSVEEFANFAISMAEVLDPSAYAAASGVARVMKGFKKTEQNSPQAPGTDGKMGVPAGTGDVQQFANAPASDTAAGAKNPDMKVPGASTGSADAIAAAPQDAAPGGSSIPGGKDATQADGSAATGGKAPAAEKCSTCGKAKGSCDCSGEVAQKADKTSEILAALAGLNAQIAQVATVQKAQSAQIAATAQATESLKAATQEAVKKADAAARAVAGTVAAPPPPDDEPARPTVRKSDDATGMGVGYWDSALEKKRARK